MKKLLCAIAAITVCAALTACGGDNDSSNNTAPETTETTASTTAAPDDTAPEEPTETQTQDETTAVSEETAAEKDTETDITAEETTAETTTFSELEEVTTAVDNTPETQLTDNEPTEPDEPDAPASEEEIDIDDSADDITVSSSFADMDEFLSADIFMLNGKTATADNTLSASVFDTLDGDFYLETSDFDGGTAFTLAMKGSNIMTETKADGKNSKMIIADSKAYTFDDENKVALFLPADKELISQYAPEKMGIVPENVSKESFVIADVTIAGKAYKFEYGTSSDWAMLYDAGGKLYASVSSGDSLDLVLRKFSVTSKIPSGAFNIPEDYMQLDLEEILQNPPPENME